MILQELSRSVFYAAILFLCADIFPQDRQTFPIAKGTYWIYDAKLQWNELRPLPAGGTVLTENVRRKSLSWRMQVLQSDVRGDVTLAVIEGYPSDLQDYFGGELRPKKHSMIIVNGTKFYETLFEPHEDFFDELISGTKSVEEWKIELVKKIPLFFELPLYKGKFFGNPEDYGYPGQGWIVLSETSANLSAITGITTLKTAAIYRLFDGYNTSEETVDFVPDLGIVAFAHDHHSGSLITKCEVKLVEFHDFGRK